MDRMRRFNVYARVLVLLVTVGALFLGPTGRALTATGSGSGGTAAAPDFELVPSSPHTGFLVHGGLQSCTVQAGFCFGGLTEPKYVSGEINGDSSWVVNSINVLAVNGFTGVVNLEVLGLPAGVASQTAPSVTLDGSPSCCFVGRSGADTPFA